MGIYFKKYILVIYAQTASLLYDLNDPFSKLLVKELNPLFLAALLYLGVGIWMLIIDAARNYRNKAFGKQG